MVEESPEEVDELPFWSRTYCGYHERFVQPFTLSINGKALTVRQAPCASNGHAQEASSTSDGMCTGSTVWDAGIVLAACLLETGLLSRLVGRGNAGRCLELGAGTGLAGIAAAATGNFSYLRMTDLATVVPLVQQNVELNRKSFPRQVLVEAICLRWDSEVDLQNASRKGPFDVILGSDLLYRRPVIEPLLKALTCLAEKHTIVLLAASVGHSPETVREFCARAGQRFRVERLPVSMQCQQYSSSEVQLLRLSCKDGIGCPQVLRVPKTLSGQKQCRRLRRVNKFFRAKPLRRLRQLKHVFLGKQALQHPAR